ncbi:hypothetical protein [Sabulicella glaciei]|uniref:DUF2384 domain-containing protein n=1 Tax=Sabulicella glaciei TaxID=2984948 RepID=A0ABT3NZM9_9PROT|nr:hypothetical protein [Roseococcus sp. MDT2-1-1]MCW8087598.1 hypothetical protein [Roseococcus sp. MDT2-1-1]
MDGRKEPMDLHEHATDEQIARFEAAAAELLERAGGALSLAQAAKDLKLSPEALLEQIRHGAALGIKTLQGTILVPTVQFAAEDGRITLLEGLAHAVRLFVRSKRGGWAALQWLIAENESLGTTPLQALRERRFEEVEATARHFVGDDEA